MVYTIPSIPLRLIMVFGWHHEGAPRLSPLTGCCAMPTNLAQHPVRIAGLIWPCSRKPSKAPWLMKSAVLDPFRRSSLPGMPPRRSVVEVFFQSRLNIPHVSRQSKHVALTRSCRRQPRLAMDWVVTRLKARWINIIRLSVLSSRASMRRERSSRAEIQGNGYRDRKESVGRTMTWRG
ncbi:hypothetical protein K505DRAFT_161565 [Melanomma pulvis-pyrius CBS 109.77]|uniref:Uncharacterized protein n=1 Tax=Melanomma pulvis-pyrius CBS 109.77 TaxID=1314802 RepID=A0A6A6XJ32_9PLEO|nr:hypothetical protein K505DRAFT_161565 [Melanomma pulvis-pyrius CBS 109.77]